MEDVLEVYRRRYDPQHPVICMDEASKQLVAEVRQPLPPRPGQPLRYDCEYERRGTCNIFMFRCPACLHGVRSDRVPPLRRYYQGTTTSCRSSRRTSLPSLARPHARLASRCWSDSPGRALHPQGSDERFQTHVMLIILLSQACLAQSSSLFMNSWQERIAFYRIVAQPWSIKRGST